MRRISQDVAGGVLIAALSLIYLAEARRLPFGTLSSPEMGLLPISLGWAMLALCFLLTLRGAVARRRALVEARPDGAATWPRRPLGRSLVIVGCLAVYPLVLTAAGFLPATAAVLLVIFRSVRYGSWLASVVATIATTLVAYLVFAVWLHVYFPKGFWG